MGDQPQPESPEAAARSTDAVLDMVLELLETEGYDGVQLRRVAQLAKVSLSTIYKRFPTRDELIVSAIARWMAENRFARLEIDPGGASLYESLMRVFRHIFEPWERHPEMLRAYHRARTGPGGSRLVQQGSDIVEPVLTRLTSGMDPDWTADFDLIISNLVYSLMGRFACGEIAITEILPSLDRVVRRLTSSTATGDKRAKSRHAGDAPVRSRSSA
jgi:AcrR family transcriptional regulator